MTTAPVSGQLPPIGEAISANRGHEIVQAVYARRQAIINALAKPLAWAKTCRRIAAFGEDVEDPTESDTVVHKIRQAIETQVANHLKEPVRVTIEPVETGEYARWYWCGPSGSEQEAFAIGLPIDPIHLGAVTPLGEHIEPVPLPMLYVKMFQQYSQAGLIDPDYICKLDDEYTAKTLQKDFDSDWQASGIDKWLRSRAYANLVEGWQLPFYEYDKKTLKHLPRRNSIAQTYIDQTCEDIDDATEAGIDLYMDLDEAIALYPDHADFFANKKGVSETSLTPPGTGGVLPVQYQGNFDRPMLKQVVWWIRNQPVNVPMEAAEAVAAGLVLEQVVIDELMQQAGEAPGQTVGETAQPAAGGESGELLPNDGSGIAQPSAGLPAPTRTAYILPLTGEEVTAESPDWPKKTEYAIRQCTIVADELVDDIVCPFPDIPILHLRNTLITGRPWGIGEPFYTQKLQEAETKIVTSAARHVHYNANPAMEIYEPLYQHLLDEYGTALMTPGRMVSKPARFFPPTGPNVPLVQPIMPPPFPESSFRILQMIDDKFNDVGGRPDVMSGTIPSANASGKMVQSLQAAAVEPLNFKAQEIGFAAEKLGKLMLHSILNFKPHEVIAQTTSVPLPLLKMIIKRCQGRAPNVSATVSTGAGTMLERKRAQTLQFNQTIDPATHLPLVSAQTTRELMNIDHNVEDRRNRDAIRDAAMSMAPMQQQEGQGGSGGQTEKSGSGNGSSNGNGRFHGE